MEKSGFLSLLLLGLLSTLQVTTARPHQVEKSNLPQVEQPSRLGQEVLSGQDSGLVQEIAKPQKRVKKALEVITAPAATKIFEDHGSGAYKDLAVFEPQLQISGKQYYMLGHYAQRGYSDEPFFAIQIVRPLVKSAIKPPSDMVEVWHDLSSVSIQEDDVSFWHVICPNGYTALGDVIATSYDSPIDDIKSKYACIRNDLTTSGSSGPVIWNDKGSGAPIDGSMWWVQCPLGLAVPAYFQAQNGYTSPEASRFKCIKYKLT